MKSLTLIVVILLATSSIYADDASSYEVGFSNAKVNYIDVPKLSLQLKSEEKNGFEFMLAFATSLFSNTKEQDSIQKQHTMYVALNYKF